MFKADTIAALATPPGEGGIAIVRVSGPSARSIAKQVFQPHRGDDPATYSGYSVHYGAFVSAPQGEVIDDGLLTVFRAPHSYTGEDTIELACHGGRVTSGNVLTLTLQAGARLAEPGEFTLRAFLNGRLDLAQAEAVADVIRARTDASCRLARRQLEGSLSQAILTLKDELVGILAAIEVTIDFSEEVGELEHEPILHRIQTVQAGIGNLLANADRGRILREGLRVAIVGRPNVGKSSLLNALLRTERAIVTPIAGTTRDVVEESASVQGIPVVFVDTAGIRPTSDLVEQIGVERATHAAASADVLLFVLDAETGITEKDKVVAKTIGGKILVVINKCDLASEKQLQAVQEQSLSLFSYPIAGVVTISAQLGVSLNLLEEILIEVGTGNSSLKGGQETGSLSDSVIVANTRHQQALQSAERSLEEARMTTLQRLPGDFIAIDVRGALDALGLITGETVTDDIIHRIFQDFCVGK